MCQFPISVMLVLEITGCHCRQLIFGNDLCMGREMTLGWCLGLTVPELSWSGGGGWIHGTVSPGESGL